MSRTPPPIPAYAERTFALFTISKRIPKILDDVVSQFDDRERRDPRWTELRAAILSGGAIDTRQLVSSTRFWKRKISDLEGRRWSDLPFFDLEFLFYHGLNSIATDLRPGFDIFAAARRAALRDGLPKAARVAEATPVALDAALLLATGANEEDLSQLASTKNGATLLVDERAALIECLGTRRDQPIVVLADNAGAELCFDLLLVDALLCSRDGGIRLHLKSQPMFVSDALPEDVEATVDAFSSESTAGLAAAGRRLRSALAEGRLVLEAPADWAEPRHMNSLEKDLEQTLQRAHVVLAKGDLNYRRFFEDRSWPPDSSVGVASVLHGARAFALRVLKSDSVVGIDTARVAELQQRDPEWRSNGRYAVLQRVDAAA